MAYYLITPETTTPAVRKRSLLVKPCLRLQICTEAQRENRGWNGGGDGCDSCTPFSLHSFHSFPDSLHPFVERTNPVNSRKLLAVAGIRSFTCAMDGRFLCHQPPPTLFLLGPPDLAHSWTFEILN